MSGNYGEAIRQVGYTVEELKSQIAHLQGKADLLSRQNTENEARLEEYKTDREVFKKAIELIAVAGEAVRENIKGGFEKIVTHALRSIVGEDYSFAITFDKRGNQQEANFTIKSGDLSEAFNPMDSRGGGIIDIVSLALRVSLLELTQPKVDGPLILDEPFKHLSKEYIENANVFLKGLSDKLGRQIICVTHIRELANEADKIIEI